MRVAAPEKLLRAQLLQGLYTIGSERAPADGTARLQLLFRWFVGLEMDDPIWNPTVFTKNRERLLAGDVAHAFFVRVVTPARDRGLLSDEHFTVDGTLVEAWASVKSRRRLRPARERPRRTRRRARIAGRPEHDGPVTVGADKGYDTRDFVAAVRLLGVTPHVAQNTSRRRSAIDGRTTRHAGLASVSRKSSAGSRLDVYLRARRLQLGPRPQPRRVRRVMPSDLPRARGLSFP